MDFSKIGASWSRVSFSFDDETPQELRVDMFVRRTQATAAVKDLNKARFDIGWAHEFNMDNTCSFKSLERVGQETGIDFALIGVPGDLAEQFAISNVSKRDVVWVHTISRFWAIKNGLVERVSQKQDDTETAALIEEKMKRLEKMTFKVLEQNKTIFKTIKKGSQT